MNEPRSYSGLTKTEQQRWDPNLRFRVHSQTGEVVSFDLRKPEEFRAYAEEADASAAIFAEECERFYSALLAESFDSTQALQLLCSLYRKA